MSHGREFENPYADFQLSETVSGHNVIEQRDGTWTLKSEFASRLQSHVDAGVERLTAQYLADDEHTGDLSVYTGLAGVGLLFCRLSSRSPQSHHLKICERIHGRLYAAQARRQHGATARASRVVSLLCGSVGEWAVTAALCGVIGAPAHHHTSTVTNSLQPSIDKIVSASALVIDRDNKQLPDELLYGRVGYLASLLYLRASNVPVAGLTELIKQTVDVVIWSGKRSCCERPVVSSSHALHSCPLMYTWHDKHYLGAAHGVAGIITLLLQVHEVVGHTRLHSLLRPTIDYLASLQLASGNFPSSLESVAADRLVQWCHGAPAFVSMFCLAYQVFGEVRYRQLAVSCCDLTWRRGLLQKGHSICHGTAGNAYAFLHVYQITQDARYLYRACCLARWSMECRETCRQPDRPFSLFEGLAGTLYFLVDMMDPANAKFPCFVF